MRADSFLSKVAKTGRCWVWTASKNKKGYGVFSIKHRTVLAHRASWALHRGPIPHGACVLHRCDNPCCVKPGHLFLGTRADNNTDMWEKGRGVTGNAKGEKARTSKLTSVIVTKLRAAYDKNPDSFPVSAMAAKNHVGYQTIWRVVTRRSWKHI